MKKTKDEDSILDRPMAQLYIADTDVFMNLYAPFVVVPTEGSFYVLACDPDDKYSDLSLIQGEILRKFYDYATEFDHMLNPVFKSHIHSFDQFKNTWSVSIELYTEADYNKKFGVTNPLRTFQDAFYPTRKQ